MYKRRDWLDVHGRDGGSSDSSESGSEIDASADSQDDASSSGQETSSASEASSSEDDSAPAQPPRARPVPRQQQLHALNVQSDSDEDDSILQKEGSETDEDESDGEQQPQATMAERQQLQGQHKWQSQQHGQSPLERSTARVQQQEGSEQDGEADGSSAEASGSDSERLEKHSDASERSGGEELEEGSTDKQYEDLHVEEVIRNWTEANDEETVRGVALKCMACKALLLNAAVFKDHLQSKKHQRQLASWTEGEDEVIVFATDTQLYEDVETHAERLQRLQQHAAVQGPAAGGGKQGSKKIRRAGSKGKRPPKKRPGKRQRAALKQEGQGPAQKKQRIGTV